MVFRSFFEQGGDSLSMVQLISVLNDYGHYIGMTEFVMSQNLAEVVKGLKGEEERAAAAGGDLSRVMEKLREGGCDFVSESMRPEHEKVVIDMISRSFADKGDLTTLAGVNYDILYEQGLFSIMTFKSLLPIRGLKYLDIMCRNGAGIVRH